MSETTNESLCPSCVNSINCETLGEVKCLAHKKRIYGYKTLTNCTFYKKRGKDFKETLCQCEECLREARDEEE